MASLRVRQILLVCLLLTWCGLTAAQVYKTVDENGRVTYTNTPGDKPAEKVDIAEPNTMEPVQTRTPLPQDRKPTAVPSSYEVTITSPSNDMHLNPGEWNLAIQVATVPDLDSSHRVQITDNGAVVSNEGTAATISNILRGSHIIQAQVMDAGGRILGSSEPVTVYVHRPTVAK